MAMNSQDKLTQIVDEYFKKRLPEIIKEWNKTKEIKKLKEMLNKP